MGGVRLYQAGETIHMGSRPRGVMVSAPSGPTFLMRFDFNVDASAPLGSPHTEGLGSLTLVQTDGQLSVSSGKLNFPAQASPNWGDLGLFGNGVSRVAGLCLAGQFSFSSIPADGGVFGWGNAGNLNIANTQAVLNVTGNVTIGVAFYSGSANINKILPDLSTATNYPVAIALRGTGAFVLVRISGAWTLAWVEASQTFGTCYPMFNNYSLTGTLDTFRVLQLSSPFSTDYGLATQRLSGSVSAGTAFSHEANHLVEWTQTTKPSADYTDVCIRYQDDNNTWVIEVDSTGALVLWEVVSGVWTSRASNAAGVANGHRVVGIADGSTIRGYSNNALRWAYSSASGGASRTAGKVLALGTSGAIGNLVTWPRTLSGSAATILDSAIA